MTSRRRRGVGWRTSPAVGAGDRAAPARCAARGRSAYRAAVSRFERLEGLLVKGRVEVVGHDEPAAIDAEDSALGADRDKSRHGLTSTHDDDLLSRRDPI